MDTNCDIELNGDKRELLAQTFFFSDHLTRALGIEPFVACSRRIIHLRGLVFSIRISYPE